MTGSDVHEILDGWRRMPPDELDGRRAMLTLRGGTVVDGVLEAFDRPGGIVLAFDEAPSVTAALCGRDNGLWRSTPVDGTLLVYRERPDREGVRP